MELGEATTSKPHLSAEWAELLSSLLSPAQVLSSILAVRRGGRAQPIRRWRTNVLTVTSVLFACSGLCAHSSLWASDPRLICLGTLFV